MNSILVHNGSTANPKGDYDTSAVVYRGDGRSQHEIFAEGLKAKNPNAKVDLQTYVNSTPSPDSQFVSTSTNKNVSIDFATNFNQNKGFLYDIDFPKAGIDVKKTLGNKAKFNENEIAVPHNISNCAIRGCQKYNIDGVPEGQYIHNPNYKGK